MRKKGRKREKYRRQRLPECKRKKEKRNTRRRKKTKETEHPSASLETEVNISSRLYLNAAMVYFNLSISSDSLIV